MKKPILHDLFSRFVTNEESVKVIRHTSNMKLQYKEKSDYLKMLYCDGLFDYYQMGQNKNIFKGTDMIFSFVKSSSFPNASAAFPNTSAIFVGAYKLTRLITEAEFRSRLPQNREAIRFFEQMIEIKPRDRKNGERVYFYDLIKMSLAEEFCGNLLINWGKMCNPPHNCQKYSEAKYKCILDPNSKGGWDCEKS